jgi:hypothetical protein
MKKKLILSLVFAACFMLFSGVASAHDYDRDDDGHPLRLVAHVMHPFGLALEYAIFRPVHDIASRPKLNIIFGHVSHEGDVLWSWE